MIEGLNLHATKVRRVHAEILWRELDSLGWNNEEIRRRTGLDRNVIKQFVSRKRASLSTGGRLALAIAAGRACE